MGARYEHTVEIDYTNWKGERRLRRIIPLKLWYGENEYRRGDQWILSAMDMEDGGKIKTFSLTGVRGWWTKPEGGLQPGMKVVPLGRRNAGKKTKPWTVVDVEWSTDEYAGVTLEDEQGRKSGGVKAEWVEYDPALDDEFAVDEQVIFQEKVRQTMDKDVATLRKILADKAKTSAKDKPKPRNLEAEFYWKAVLVFSPYWITAIIGMLYVLYLWIFS
jgi:hypothetical protein